MLVLLVVALWAPASAAEARSQVGVRTEVAGTQLPSSTLSAQWSRTSGRRGTLSAQGWNAPGAVSTVAGRLTIAGPTVAGSLCVTRKYTVEAAGQPSVGRFRQVVELVHGGRRRTLAGLEDPYTASPVDIRYAVTQRLEITVPRIQAGARLVWRFTGKLDVPVTTYEERVRVRVRRATC